MNWKTKKWGPQMFPSNPTELVEELNATSERSYVRKKLALGGFADWQGPVAQHWLNERQSERAAKALRRTAMWTLVSLAVAVAGLLVRYHGGGG